MRVPLSQAFAHDQWITDGDVRYGVGSLTALRDDVDAVDDAGEVGGEVMLDSKAEAAQNIDRARSGGWAEGRIVMHDERDTEPPALKSEIVHVRVRWYAPPDARSEDAGDYFGLNAETGAGSGVHVHGD